jgi:transcription factor E
MRLVQCSINIYHVINSNYLSKTSVIVLMASITKTGVVRDVLVESLSESHVNVLDRLSEPKYDEDVAGELKLKATIVRTLLNDLHENSLVEYQRTKNKKTGWYTYLWVRREDKIKEYVQKYLKTHLFELNTRLDDETKNVTFQCECTRVPYSTAMETNFVCPSCSKEFSECDNSEIIDEIVSEVSRLGSLLEQT